MNVSAKPLNFDKLAFETGRKIHNHTIQFLVKGGKYGYKPYGSGVLVFTGKKCVIFTAAHVTENSADQPLYVNSIKGIVSVDGDLRETDLDKDTLTDLAYIILDDKLASILVQSYDFLPISKVMHSHKTVDANRYLIVGYPERNIVADADTKTIRVGSNSYLLSPSQQKVYEYYKLDINRHYVFDFAGKGINMANGERSGKILEPYGISGCGVWLLTINNDPEIQDLKYSLIGIMIEFKKGKYYCLIGNRIEMIVSALTQLDSFNIVMK